jgi:hypothetical protein
VNSWINLNALWKIIVIGLLTGAGLPALFAIGLRLLSPLPPAGPAATDRPTAGPVGYALAGLCFAGVLAAIGWGLAVIVNHS